MCIQGVYTAHDVHFHILTCCLPCTCRYQESAMMYAQTQNSFEEIALKFIKLDGKDALKSFIQKKLSSLRTQVLMSRIKKMIVWKYIKGKRFFKIKPTVWENLRVKVLIVGFFCLNQDKTQITMLVTWLIEIFLNQLGEMKEQGQDESEEYRKVQEEFRMFLAQPKNKVLVWTQTITWIHRSLEWKIYFEDILFQCILLVISVNSVSLHTLFVLCIVGVCQQ